MFQRFIERPVLSTVISIIIVMLGILGYTQLPVEQYPNIAPPTVSVSASYPGANADVVLNSVIVPLEEQINGVEGMTYMTSSATNEGAGTISVYFKVGTNPDQAAINVQNRVASASSLLPQEVAQTGVNVRKAQSSNLLIAAVYSDDPTFDQTFLQNYLQVNLVPQLQRVNGVGSATTFGSMTFSMRIWLKPDVMAIYGLVPADVATALSQQNIEAAPGKFGENSNQSFQYVIRYRGKLKSVSDFENIVVKSAANGQLLRLKDIARVELGSQSYSTSSIVNGKPAAMIAISQTAGSNATQIIEDAKKVMDEAAKSFPRGLNYTYLVDINKFLNASFDKVLHTLIEAFILVFLVVFIFLQDLRSTLIPAISVPVAIVGTFFFLNLFGFSINLLTLFALVLAIGIVVDDAIVVVEAVHAKLDAGYTSARKAAVDAMNEISGAIISITLVMAAVFVPVTFIGGSTGVFYKQFGITLAIAILLSAINALTLSPALAALFLTPHQMEHRKKNFLQRFYTGFNAAFETVTARYTRTVRFLSGRRWLAVGLLFLFSSALFLLLKTTPSSFVPDEDMGTVFVNISMPPATSLERTTQVADEVEKMARSIPQVNNVLRLAGQNFMAGTGSAYAMIILELKPWNERKGVSNTGVIARVMQKTSHIRDGAIMAMSLPTITGFGISGGFSFQLQDRAGHGVDEFYKVAQRFLSDLNKRPEIQYAATSFNPNFPQYVLDVNVARASDAGLDAQSILNVMQAYYGGSYVSNFNLFGKQYRVMMQADTAYRASPQGLNNIYVRTANKSMAPITEFISLQRAYGPESISRFNLYTAIAVNGSPKEGYSSGQALNAIKEVAARSLPAGYGFEFSGQSREEQNAGTQSAYVFLLCFLFVYFLLSAQYESYLLPLAVLLTLPVGLTGTFVFAKVFGIDNNIYMQISLIMLIGLLSKNAILIVEFALDRRREGMELVQAAVEGAKARLRPILMTSFAFILGLMPLMFATGAGAHGNRSIGTAAVGGMLFGTLLGVFVIPVLFLIFQTIQERFRKKRGSGEESGAA